MRKNNQALLTKALDLLLDVICIVDKEGRFVAVSAACEQVFGYTQQEMIGKSMIELIYPPDLERTLQAASTVVAGTLLRNFENRYVRKDGEVIDIMWSARWSEADQLRLAVAREVTQRKRAESMQLALHGIADAAQSSKTLDELFRRIHQIIADMLPTGGFFVALYDDMADQISFPYFVDEGERPPPSGSLSSGSLAAVVIRNRAAMLLVPECREDWPQCMQVSPEAAACDWLGVPLAADHRIIGALLVRGASAAQRLGEQHKSLLQFVSAQIAANIERKQAEERLHYLAQYDMLTGLVNRAMFDERLQSAIASAERNGERLALLYLDLDNFKPVNDFLGHAIGDFLLQEIAQRMRNCVRASDTVGRIGGDEFVVLLGTVLTAENAVQLGENIRAQINLPALLQGNPVQVSSSIGIAVYPDHATHKTHLLRCADDAMYAAKKQGGNCCQLYQPA